METVSGGWEAPFPDAMLFSCTSGLVMLDLDPASRRSGEPGIPPSVGQPLLRLQ